MENQHSQLLHFLQEDLGIPPSDLGLALQHPEQTTTLLPIILWQYGLVTLAQLSQILDWLEYSI